MTTVKWISEIRAGCCGIWGEIQLISASFPSPIETSESSLWIMASFLDYGWFSPQMLLSNKPQIERNEFAITTSNRGDNNTLKKTGQAKKRLGNRDIHSKICTTTHEMSASWSTTSGILCHWIHIFYSIREFSFTDFPILTMKANLTTPPPRCSVSLYEHLPFVELQTNAFTNPSCRHVSFQGILAFYRLFLQFRLDFVCLDWQVYMSGLSLGDTLSAVDKALSKLPFCQKKIPNSAAAHTE